MAKKETTPTSDLEVTVKVVGQGSITFDEDHTFLSPIKIIGKSKDLIQQLFETQLRVDLVGFIQQLHYVISPDVYIWNRLSDPQFDVYDYIKLEDSEKVNFLFVITQKKGLFPISEVFGLNFNPEATKLIHVIRRYRKHVDPNDQILYFVGLGQYNDIEGINFLVNPENDEHIKTFRRLGGKVINLKRQQEEFICRYHQSLILSLSSILEANPHIFDCKDAIIDKQEDDINKIEDMTFEFEEDGIEYEKIEIEGLDDLKV